jgi:hypothetical protein
LLNFPLVVIGISALALSGCATAASTNAAGSGRVVGVIEAVGGPAPGTPRTLSGMAYLQETHGAIKMSVHVSSSGKFSATVPAGTYKVSGRSPQFNGEKVSCNAAGSISVKKAKTTHALVMCQEM